MTTTDHVAPCCGNCRYFDRFAGRYHDVGECHRYPPVLAEAVAQDGAKVRQESIAEAVCEGSRAWVFPVLNEESWCGEHQPATPS